MKAAKLHTHILILLCVHITVKIVQMICIYKTNTIVRKQNQRGRAATTTATAQAEVHADQ